MSPTILIMGDSWGLPSRPPLNYISKTVEKIKSLNPNAEITHNHLGDLPETHLEFLLQDAGYSVINTSKSGSSNLESIQRAAQYIDNQSKNIDYLIWFHTESLRDFHDTEEPFNIESTTRLLSIQAYIEFEKRFGNNDCKKIIIGGQAPVLKEEFNQYVSTPLLLIEDWHSDILGTKLPFTHALCHINLIDHPKCIDPYSKKMKTLEQIEQILDLDALSKDFPDNAHPGKDPHKKLFNTINTKINDFTY